jgi:hypothetical protein
MALVDGLGNLIDFTLMPGQRHDSQGVAAQIADITFDAFLGDKAAASAVGEKKCPLNGTRYHRTLIICIRLNKAISAGGWPSMRITDRRDDDLNEEAGGQKLLWRACKEKIAYVRGRTAADT